MKIPIFLTLPLFFITSALADNLFKSSVRDNLDKAGIEIDGTYKITYFNNFRGSLNQGSIVSSNLNLNLNLDGQEFINNPDVKLFINFQSNYGGKINKDYIGSNLGINNVEVSYGTTKLNQMWFEHKFFNNKFSILAGIYSLDSEFYITNTTGNFIASTYGIGSEFGNSGINGPSIYPNTSPAIRILIEPTDKFYIKTAILNAVAAEPDLPRGTHYRFNEGDGILQILEIGAQQDIYKTAVGSWYYSKSYDNYINNLPKSRSQGAYFLAEKLLYKANDKKNLWGFFRIGNASPEMNPFEYSYSIGLVYNGIVDKREDSQIGFSIARGRNSKQYMQSNNLTKDYETILGTYYFDKINNYCSISPSLQYVINPGGLDVKNAFLMGLQLTLSI